MNKTSRVGACLLGLVSAVLGLVACSDSEGGSERVVAGAGGDGDDGIAGAGGSAAGEGGAAGSSAGAAGSSAGEGNGAQNECPSMTLAEYCQSNPCPVAPDDIDLGYCDGDSDGSPHIIEQHSSCGGVAIVRGTNYGGGEYHWDAEGTLVSLSWASDDGFPECVVGAECQLVGAETFLCGDSAQCPTTVLKELCARSDRYPGACPNEPAEVTTGARCNQPGSSVQSFAACGGTVYRHVTADTTTEWTFDAASALVGVTIAGPEIERCLDGGYSKVAVFGKPCAVMGTGDWVCGDNGTAGAGGAAGEGGAGG
jgi:hypothetical protein